MKIWNELDPELTELPSLASFKNALLSFVRPTPNSLFGAHNPLGVVLLTRLRVGLSHLREHSFRHNFTVIVDPFCLCGTNSIETTEHYLLHCPQFSSHRKFLFANLQNRGLSLLPYSSSYLTNVLLYGSSQLNNGLNLLIMNEIFEFLINSKRFEGSPLL